MTILFLKRMNDTFEEEAEKLLKTGKSEKEAWENKLRHSFFVPKEARWSVLSKASENIGEKIDRVCRIIERENPDLDGVLTNTKYNDKRKYPDDRLRKLISHFNSPRLGNSDLEKEDLFGDAYEYLIEQFADQIKKKGGEFFTPREVVRLLVNLVEPSEKELAELESRYKDAMAHVQDIGRNDDNAIFIKFEPAATRDQFEYDFKAFSRALDAVLPKKEADKYVDDFKYLSKVRQMIRTYYEGVGVSLREYGKKVQQLIDDHIRSRHIRADESKRSPMTTFSAMRPSSEMRGPRPR